MTKTNRIKWIDYSKGIGIILVVLGHVIGGLHDSNLHTPNFLYKYIFGIIYLFHMPLFFILSGFFAIKFCEKHNFKTAVLNKLRTLAYPYFIWTFIYMPIETIVSNNTNHHYKYGFKDLFYILYEPFSFLWFLYDLFWCFILFYILKKLFSLKLIFLISLIMYILSPIFTNIGLYALFSNFIFFISGAILYEFIQKNNADENFVKIFSNKYKLAATIIVFLIISSFIIYFDLNSKIIKLIPALLGILSVINLSIVLEKSDRKIFQIFNYLGIFSMQIYLMHILFVAGMRIILIKFFALYNLSILIPLCLISGLIFPVLFNNIVAKLGISTYFWGLTDKFRLYSYKKRSMEDYNIQTINGN